MNRSETIVELMRNLIESKVQAEHDFVGEQREWHLPRLNAAFALACKLFPGDLIEAMREAKDAYGDYLVPRDATP